MRRTNGKRALRTDDHSAFLRLKPDDVERLLLPSDLESAALADGEMDEAAMLA
jgi:hypothetical protein